MAKAERIALWVLLIVVVVWLLVLTAMTAGEVAAIHRLLGQSQAAEGAAQAPADATPWWGGGAGIGATPAPSWETEATAYPPGPAQVGVAGMQVVSGTTMMTVTVRSSGAGDLLCEPPILADGEGRVYPITAESLEQARLAFLDLITRGQAQARLAFVGEPGEGARLVLVFNPAQERSNPLTPRLEIPVPVIGATGSLLEE